MKVILAIIAFMAVIGMTSATTVSIGNGMLYDIPYITLPGGLTEIDMTASGIHVQGVTADYFGDKGTTFIGTVSYINGTKINNLNGSATAMGAVLAIMDADYTNVEVAMAKDGTINGATPDASIKVGSYKGEDGFVLVTASNSNSQGDHGASTVHMMCMMGTLTEESNEPFSRLASF